MSYTGKNIDLSKYDKYGKNVELSKVEVELGAVQDLEKRVEQFESENKEVVKLINSLESVRSKFKSLDKKIASDFQNLRKDANTLFKKTADLGLDTKIPFQLEAKIAKLYGEDWDMDAINFLRK